MKKLIIAAALLLVVGTVSGQSFFGLSYSTAAPLGPTSSFISNYSWRGLNMEFRWFMNPQLSAGVFFNWNVFYEKLSGEFVDETQTVFGTQQRYLNVFPILAEAHYYLNDDFARVRPYVGAGLGTQFTRQRTEMGIFAVERSSWQFAVAPSAGVLFGFGGGTSLNLAARYYYAPKSGNLLSDISSLGVSLGFAWGD